MLFESVGQYLQYHATMRGDITMASDVTKSLTYAEAWQYTGRIAAAIQRQGLGKGDRVGILAKNSVDNLAIFLACARIGVVAVGLNYRLSIDELDFISRDAGIALLFLDEEFAHLRGPHLQSAAAVCLDASLSDAPLLAEWLQDACEPVPEAISHDDILFHMYTSGTTGRPKGVLISQGNVLINTYQGPLSSGMWSRVGERALVISPTFHAVGLVSSLAGVIYGGTMVIHREYDPVAMIETLANEHINSVAVIPVMLQFSLMMVPNIRDYDFSHLHTIGYGASPISESLLRECMDIFGCDFVQGYGQTESTTSLTFLTADDHRKALAGEPELLRSCGRAVAGTELAIVDRAGNHLCAGETGEIVARGPQVMQGYWNNPEATANTVVDGWLHTGDAGYLDERGYLFIKDRVKDMIISGGENVYPVEIENVLMAHPDIQDAAVIGIPDAKWGEVPLAILVNREGKRLGADDLMTHCKGRLAGYKIPRQLAYVDALPRNPSGKILKKELRQQFREDSATAGGSR